MGFSPKLKADAKMAAHLSGKASVMAIVPTFATEGRQCASNPAKAAVITNICLKKKAVASFSSKYIPTRALPYVWMYGLCILALEEDCLSRKSIKIHIKKTT